MRKIYIAPEMEILDSELEGGILTASQKKEEGFLDGDNLARQSNEGFSFDEDEEDF